MERLVINFIVIIILFSSVSAQSQKLPPNVSFNGGSFKFEHFLFNYFNNDSLCNKYKDVCSNGISFAKFKIDNKKNMSRIAFSFNTDPFFKNNIQSIIESLNGLWSNRCKNTEFLLPLYINVNRSRCIESDDIFYTQEGSLSIENFFQINSFNEKKEGIDSFWLFMKEKRFEGVVLHPLSISSACVSDNFDWFK